MSTTAPVQETTNTDSIIREAKAEFNRAKDRLARALATTPDDKINWSPSATCRTPIQIVAHAAKSTAFIQDMLNGKPFPFESPADLDAKSREMEKQYTSRAQVSELLNETSESYLEWLDTLTPQQVSSDIDLAFGTFPMSNAITFAADHLRNHAGQIEYIQTIYGDLDWHIQS